MSRIYTFTSESVSAGHPDKIADQISDLILDEALRNGDETTRCAVETMVTTNQIVLAGEVKNFNLTEREIQDKIRNYLRTNELSTPGFDSDAIQITNFIHAQSADIARGTDDFGAGDQGIMFGYASNENDAYMPTPIYLAHRLLRKLHASRLNGSRHYLLPDAKAQISVVYENDTPKYISRIVCSHQHKPGEELSVRDAVKGASFEAFGNLIRDNTEWFINPTGKFEIGGPDGDAGVTGRKIIVDTYGGWAPHGGGAFSGKDPTKVDRSAAYAARWLAKNIVMDGMADWCQIQLSYAIGIKEPISIYVDSNGHNKSIEQFIIQNVDLTPKGIIDRFDLFNFTEYGKNCVYGHFGDKDVPWEKPW